MVVALNPRCQGVAIHEAMATFIRRLPTWTEQASQVAPVPSPPQAPLALQYRQILQFCPVQS